MDLDPKIIAAIIGLLAVIISAVISYAVSKNIESRKTTIEYLNRKIILLEEKKYLLAELNIEHFGEGVNKENFTEKFIDALFKKHRICSKIFRETSHYLDKQLVERIEKEIGEINATRGAQGIEEFLEIQMPGSPMGKPEATMELIQRLSDTAEVIESAIDDELRTSVEKIESLGRMKK